jgi:serine/threonine protein kinase
MNEDPTIPIGELTPPILGVPAEAPAPTTAWGGFNLLSRVGHGGFGEVYRAWDPHLQREVAIKLLLPGAVAGDAEYETMLREARALASVRHPNIVPVYGIDRHDGRVAFWTDFVRGKTLSTLVREQGTFGAREAALIGLDVARALSAVHRAGLLHRDIKAENVMREEGGRILLMDFGLSALEQRQTNVAGTPNYMAPELFQGRKATVATDIYAMGVLLYFLVAGDYPVRLNGLTAAEAIEAFSRRSPLMDLRPDLPESLLRTVSTAIDLDPSKRFQSAGQLANALAESLGTHAPLDIPVDSEPRRGIKSGTNWIFAGLLAAAVIGGVSLMWYGLHARTPGPAPKTTAGSEASDEFQKAQDLLLRSYKEANVAGAVQGFQAVLKAEPDNALALADLGAAHFIQYNYSHDPTLLEKAREESNRARNMDRNLATPYITLSRIAASQRNTEMAMQLVNTALEKDKRSADAHGALGEVYEAQGKASEAIDEYGKASDLAPKDWRWPVSTGVAEFARGNVAESIKDLQNGIALADDNAAAYFNLSIAHMQSNQIHEAQKDLERSIGLDPTDGKYAALGSVLLFSREYDESIRMEKKAIEMNNNNYNAWANLGAAYRWGGKNPQRADEAFRKAIELKEASRAHGNNDAFFLATLADNYADVGQTEKSLTLIRQALALDGANPSVEYRAGEAFEALGQRDKAIPLLASAVAHGYRTYEFERNPEVASLRADPAFTARLNEERAKKN